MSSFVAKDIPNELSRVRLGEVTLTTYPIVGSKVLHSNMFFNEKLTA